MRPSEFTRGLRLEVAQDVLGALPAHWAEALAAANPDRGRLASVRNTAGVTNFLYNGLEQRVAKSGPLGTFFYAYDEAGLFHNGHRDYNPATGRYIQPDPIGLEGGINRYGYVGGNPVMWSDPDGLMGRGSGVGPQVPGTQYRVRIDPPHVPGQQTHAHVYDKQGNPITAVSQDGSSSHGSCPSKEMPKNKKLLDFLRAKSFALGIVGDVLFLQQLVNNVGNTIDPYNPFFQNPFDDGMD
ncbi:RHS repeat-associated core domain-containing protein [Leptothrix ochracea]|uniref:RHS repeat-associated core domain-containing protein n=1 Tax=Leptothrix ochracea TaxID=735331 RepID=UPI0034E1EA6E